MTRHIGNPKLIGMDAATPIYCPDTSRLESMLRAKGHHSFYRSVEDRVECCRIRKVEPLQRALRGLSIWITLMNTSPRTTCRSTPCTRAAAPGEAPRSGRWWWESSHRECGLHR